jgi:hypothetical protein
MTARLAGSTDVVAAPRAVQAFELKPPERRQPADHVDAECGARHRRGADGPARRVAVRTVTSGQSTSFVDGPLSDDGDTHAYTASIVDAAGNVGVLDLNGASAGTAFSIVAIRAAAGARRGPPARAGRLDSDRGTGASCAPPAGPRARTPRPSPLAPRPRGSLR